MSAKVEHLYIDFGDGPPVPTGTTQVGVSERLMDNIVRAGLNHKF
jgi:opacity protein-like surface antigen